MEKYNKYSTKKVAVIDSGVNRSLLDHNIFVKVTKQIYVSITDKDLEIRIENSDYFDDMHGTFVIQTISKYSKNANIDCYSFNIFNNGLASSYAVYEALVECTKITGLDMIVMSISCGDVQKKQIDKILKILKDKGVKIFSSVKNGSATSFPANSKYVYGVQGAIYLDKECFQYTPDKEIEFNADHTFEFLRCKEKIYSFSGNSKANAMISGKYIALGDGLFNDSGERTPISISHINGFDKDLKVVDYELLDELKMQGLIEECSSLDKLINFNVIDINRFEEVLKKFIPDFNICNVDYINIATIRRILFYVEKNAKTI